MRVPREDTCNSCIAQIWVGEAAANVGMGSDSQLLKAVLNKNSVLDDVLSGNSRIALAITEPDAGSDVRGLKTEAVLSDDGARLIINGQKKVCPHALPRLHSILAYGTGKALTGRIVDHRRHVRTVFPHTSQGEQ